MRARERRFVAELLRGGTPAEAAARAGYAAASARDAARRLLAKPVVRYAVERGRTQIERRTGVTRERVLEELARIAFANLGRVGDWDGERLTLASLGELGAAEAAAISTLTIYRTRASRRSPCAFTPRRRRSPRWRAISASTTGRRRRRNRAASA